MPIVRPALTHKTNNLTAAREFYQYTIDLAGDAPWYFAPNASLQLGYIEWAANDWRKAQRKLHPGPDLQAARV